MDFKFTQEQEMLRNSIRDFMKKKCPREYVRECWKKEAYPEEAYHKMAPLGWLGLPFPEEFGGGGGNAVDMAIVIEELAYGFYDLANAYLSAIITPGRAILSFGSKDQKKTYLPRLSKGEIKFCYAMTEPNAGSDALSLTTSAVQDGDSFVINGNKTFITGAHVADYIFLVTRTKKDAKKDKGLTPFIVDARSPGIETRKINKFSGKAIAACEIFFDNVKVPKENIVGELHEGWPKLSKCIQEERYSAAARSVGLARAVLDDSILYAKQREQFGRPIVSFQLIKEKLVNMQIEIEAARLLAYEAAWLSSQGLPSGKEASMAKVFATETLMRCSTQGVQILGGYGLTVEYDMYRYFFDAKQSEIGAGTNEIHRLIVAHEMGL